VDIIQELKSYGITVLVHDPKVAKMDAMQHMGVELCDWEDLQDLGALIFAVPHKELLGKSVASLAGKLTPKGSLIDVKSVLDVEEVKKYDINFWRL
jgi:UDP-N-acetyl-D-galactosamine dehydrogenase